MAIDLKQTSRRLVEEAFGKGNVDVFDELCSKDYRAHDPLTGDSDLSREKENCRMYRAAFPDLKPNILASYTDGQASVTHWRMTGTHQKDLMGIKPTGARCTVEGVTIDRYKAGKIVESWTQWDALGLMRQLGVAPTLGSDAPRTQPDTRTHA